MEQSDLIGRVSRLMSEHWGVAEGKLVRDTRLGADLCVDSLDLIQLVMGIEDEFNVEIPDDAISGRLDTVGDVFDLAAKYVTAQAQAA